MFAVAVFANGAKPLSGTCGAFSGYKVSTEGLEGHAHLHPSLLMLSNSLNKLEGVKLAAYP